MSEPWPDEYMDNIRMDYRVAVPLGVAVEHWPLNLAHQVRGGVMITDSAETAKLKLVAQGIEPILFIPCTELEACIMTQDLRSGSFCVIPPKQGAAA